MLNTGLKHFRHWGVYKTFETTIWDGRTCLNTAKFVNDLQDEKACIFWFLRLDPNSDIPFDIETCEDRIEFLQDRLLELATRNDIQDALLKLKANDPDRKLVKVTNKETINPKVIIHPKSMMGLIPLKINERKAQTVVKTE